MTYLFILRNVLHTIVRTAFVWGAAWACVAAAILGILTLASMWFVATGAPPLGIVGTPPGGIISATLLGGLFGCMSGALFGLLNPLALLARFNIRPAPLGLILGLMSATAIVLMSANETRLDTGSWPSDLEGVLVVAGILGCITGALTAHEIHTRWRTRQARWIEGPGVTART